MRPLILTCDPGAGASTGVSVRTSGAVAGLELHFFCIHSVQTASRCVVRERQRSLLVSDSHCSRQRAARFLAWNSINLSVLRCCRRDRDWEALRADSSRGATCPLRAHGAPAEFPVGGELLLKVIGWMTTPCTLRATPVVRARLTARRISDQQPALRPPRFAVCVGRCEEVMGGCAFGAGGEL